MITWLRRCRDVVQLSAAAVDRINVFPSADFDTGQNAARTLIEAHAAAARVHAMVAGQGEPGHAGETLSAAARGALLGAQGNVGVLLSQFLRGMSDAVASRTGIDATMLARGLTRAEADAQSALADPQKGSLLSIAQAAGDAAEFTAMSGHRSVAQVAAAAAEAGLACLPRTVTQQPMLARAGLVDAGALLLVLMLECLVSVAEGADQPQADAVLANWGAGIDPRSCLNTDGRRCGLRGGQTELICTLGAQQVGGLAEQLRDLGEHVVVAGTAPLWSVHVHTCEVEAVLEVVGRFGSVEQVSTIGSAPAQEPPTQMCVVLAYSSGTGLTELYQAQGFRTFTDTNPHAIRDVLATALGATYADGVLVVLPGSAEVAGTVAQLTEEQPDDRVRMLPATGHPQVVAAASVTIPGGPQEVIATLTEVIQATSWAGIRLDADLLQLPDLLAAEAAQLHEEHRRPVDLCTVVLGRNVPAVIGRMLGDVVGAALGGVEVFVVDGGLTDWLVTIGVQ